MRVSGRFAWVRRLGEAGSIDALCIQGPTALGSGVSPEPDAFPRFAVVPAREAELPKALAEAWQTLRHVTAPDAAVAAALHTVLTMTEGEPARQPRVATEPLLPSNEHSNTTPLRRATAAHPRAYRGTKFQPPKAKATIFPIDLRPYLNHPRDISEVSQLFTPPLSLPFLSQKDRGDPALAWITATDGEAATNAVLYVLKPSFLAALDESESPESENVWRELLLVLCQTYGHETAFLEDARIGAFLATLPTTEDRPWRSQALRSLRAGMPLVHLEAELTLVNRYRPRNPSLLNVTPRRTPIVEDAETLVAYVEALLLPAQNAIDKDGELGFWAPFLCECLTTNWLPTQEPEEGLYELLEGDSFRSLADSELRFFVLRKISGKWSLRGQLPNAQIAVLLAEIAENPTWCSAWLVLSLASIAMYDIHENLPDEVRSPAIVANVQRALAPTKAVRRRIVEAVPHLRAHKTLDDFLLGLVATARDEGLFVPPPEAVTEALYTTLATAPLASIRTFAKATDHADWAHWRATRSFVCVAPELLGKAFVECPRLLARALAELGRIARPARTEALQHAITTAFPDDLRALCHLIDDAQRGLGQSTDKVPDNSLVPRALRARIFSDAELGAGVRARLLRRETEIRMHLLLRAVRKALVARYLRNFREGGGAETDEDALVYAAGMARDSEKNRRSITRFLGTILREEDPRSAARAYVANHPLTVRWFGEDPKRRAFFEEWPREQFALANGDRVEIGAEDDPFEILRVGDYGASCVRLGGAFSFSAAALVLDANRRVLYARRVRAQGREAGSRPVARQIVALASIKGSARGASSGGDLLVAYSIYTDRGGFGLESEEAVEAEWISLFKAYVDARTAAFEIPRYDRDAEDDSEDQREVRSILSQDSYEDSWE